MQINPRSHRNIGARPRGNECGPPLALMVLEWVFSDLSSWCLVGGNAYMRRERRQKPITPPSLVPVHNKLSHRSGDNYLSHIIKHLEQIGGSNYRLPPGYPSPFIVLPPYITWWDLLCCAFSRAILFALCWEGRGRWGGWGECGATLTKGVWWPDALPQSRLSSFPRPLRQNGGVPPWNQGEPAVPLLMLPLPP